MRSKLARGVALAAVFSAVAALGCDLSGNPRPGLALFRSHWVQEVGDYHVDLAGGNGRYTVEMFRNGLDTHLGTFGYAFTYNSADAGWSSQFGMSYDAEVLVDDTGARYDLGNVLDGFPVPGTYWVRLNGSAIRSRGGRRYDFDAASGRLVRISLGGSAYPRLLVESDRVRQCKSSSACEDLFVMTRDTQDRIVAIAGRDRSATLSWTESGQIATLQQAGDVQAGRAGFRFEYQDGLLSAVVNPADERIEMTYEGRRVAEIAQIGEGDPRYHFAYETTEMTGVPLRATIVTDPLGGERTVAYTEDLRVEAERNQVAETTTWSWQGKQIASRTEPHGAVRSWVYSGYAGEIVTETQPSGNVVVTRPAYTGVNAGDGREVPVRLRADTLGVIESRSYDNLGRLTSITDAEGYREDFAYDLWGTWGAVDSLASHAEFDPVTTRLVEYGWHGRPTIVGFDRPLQVVYRDRIYNDAGDLLNGDDIDPEAPGLPGVLENQYDHNRYLSQKQLDFGSPGAIVRVNRFDGQLESVTRPYGGNSSFSYDALGRLISRCDVVDAVDQCTTIAYDANSNVAQIVRGDGSSETRTYDAANREIGLTYSKPGAQDMTLLRHWRDGRVDWTEDSAYAMQRDAYSYDATGEISAIDYHDGKRMEADRDLRGRVTELRLLVPDGPDYATILTLGWEYDGVDRPTHLYENGSLLLQDRYESDRLVVRTTANGNTRIWSYAAGGLGGQLEETQTGGPMISASSYIQREAGEFSMTTDLSGLSSGDLVDLEEVHHTTDVFNQPDLGRFIEGWGRDALYSFVPEVSYGFDALGNLVSAYAAPSSSHPSSQVTWNTEHNRVVSAVYDGETIDYTYNAAGEVIERDGLSVVRNAAGAVVGYGLWWAERDTRGRFVSLLGTPRVYGGTVEADSAGNPTAMDLASTRIEFEASEGGANRHYFKALDFRGNLQRIDDDAGAPLVFYRYDAFGVADVFGTPPDMPEHTFAGGLAAGEGLVLTGRRVLDPACKCYWSNDPIFNSVSQIAYTPNPLDLWDPTGEQAAPSGGGTTSMSAGSTVVAGGAGVTAAAVLSTGAAAAVGWAIGIALIAFGIYLILRGLRLS